MRRNRHIHQAIHTHGTSHNRFVELFIHIQCHLMRADGTISGLEKQTLLGVFSLTSSIWKL